MLSDGREQLRARLHGDECTRQHERATGVSPTRRGYDRNQPSETRKKPVACIRNSYVNLSPTDEFSRLRYPDLKHRTCLVIMFKNLQ